MSPLLVISSLWLVHAAPALGPEQRIDTPVVPSPAYGGQSYMGAVSNGDQIFVTWWDPRDPQASQLFGARVRHDGTALDATGLPLGNGTEPRVAWKGT